MAEETPAPTPRPAVPNPVPNPSPAPVSRSHLSSVAAHLVSEYTAGPFENNDVTQLVYIKLSVANLYSTLANTIKPIVYGNFRNIGARTITDNADITLLDNVVLTVTTNACVAAYAISYQKAIKVNANCTTLFGNYNPVDCLRFPALTTALITALGPVETSTQPYRCTFVPYLEWTDIAALLTQQGYTSHLYELFLQAMKRGRTVSMADVNLQEVKSSHWWTLYTDNHYWNPNATGGAAWVRRNNITVYCPFRFDDRDHTVILGAMVLERTLYELPGPILTATVGPFATLADPTSIDDIPDVYKPPTAVNQHYPAILARFNKIEPLTNAAAITFGTLQNDAAISNLAANHAYSGTIQSYTYDAGYNIASPKKRRRTAQPVTATVTTATTSNTSSSRAPIPTDFVNHNRAASWIATVLYFDHLLLNKVPFNRRANIVTTSNKLE